MSKRNNPFRYLPMDIGRAVYLAANPILRPHRRTIHGGRIRLEPKKGIILAANHNGFSDPFFLGTAFWHRRVFFLAAKEVMRNPLIRILLKGMGCITIDREISDIAAIRKSVEVLKAGKCLALFPQGEIERSGEMDQIKAGAVLIALQAGVPILPIYTERKKWWKCRRVIAGDPFDCRALCNKKFPSVADMEELSNQLLLKIEECKKVYEQYENK